MTDQQSSRERLVGIRRELHRRPEPAWREFWTTARVVEELERLGVDELHVGPEMLAVDERMGVPDDDEIHRWYERAREAGADVEVLERMAGGNTGALAVLDRGEGPTVGLRVDVDGLPIEESTDDDHLPAREGFRSVHEGSMHACGHDGHTAIGLGVLERILESEFEGTLKVFFQPAEEVVGGGRAVAEGGHLDDVDYLLALHLGLDHPNGEVVAGIDGFLAVAHLDAEFHGQGAHAGASPSEGYNAVQALATAVQNLYGIPRNEDGATRVNVGKVEGGTAANVVPDHAAVEGEVRGETTELMEYMKRRAEDVLEGAATTHGCEAEWSFGPEAPSAESDDELAAAVGGVAETVPGVETVLDGTDLGGSEDATYLMRAVQENGGLAAYVGVGTDHPGGHHTPTFDVDERSLSIGVDVIAGTIEQIARDRP